jgi:predicted metal-dependent HD superfamily phosphohydrolase
MLQRARFERLIARLGGRPPGDAFAALAAAYDEPHRAYHTAAHIAACLAEFDAVQRSCDAPGQVEAALWYHDAIYDTHALDNEARSADWARSVLAEAGVPPSTIEAVAHLILITAHNRVPETHDARVLLDIDLSILGAPAATFDAYEREIRSEYQWVPEAQYRTARAGILQSFLDRSHIYATPEFAERLEQRARANLRRSIEALSPSRTPPA